MEKNSRTHDLISAIGILVSVIAVIVVVMFLLLGVSLYYYSKNEKEYRFTSNEKVFSNSSISSIKEDIKEFWTPPSLERLASQQKDELEYGKDLIVHTAKYFGPDGSIAQSTNGLNCQNCHLDAGTKTFGNNYGSVNANYPKLRARSGTIEDLPKRINDCFERSLNGKSLELDSKELIAMQHYIEFLGSEVPKNTNANGGGMGEISLLDRAADPLKGALQYKNVCASCHGLDGKGQWNAQEREFLYPPLWGEHSYNESAGLYRVSNLAKFIRNNMPLGIDWEHPVLSDEQAWDIAAFINSQEHPHKRFATDWPDISKKPMDHPFGPYADPYSEQQHKYGPYKEIISFAKK